jgi:hypothetical protein
VKTVALDKVAPDILPLWALRLVRRYPGHQWNVCTCLLPTPLRMRDWYGGWLGWPSARVRIERTRNGQLTWSVKTHDCEAERAALEALRDEMPRLWF